METKKKQAEKTRAKILIIEDEVILGELLLEKLTAEGYDAVWKVDGEEGIAAMREARPDMVLLDIVMPKKDGYEVLEEMQADSGLKSIPVIVISNSGQPVEIEKILELGVKDYIVKAQFSPAEVLEKMAKWLGAGESSEPPSEDAQRAKILIVEDDPFLSSITVSHLEEHGFFVSVATDGEQALSLIEKQIPDLVLLDIVMPGINGFEVLRRIKEDDRTKQVSVIMFSNLGQEHEIEDAKKMGADAFLVKAKFTPREVLEKVEHLLKEKGVI
ncbi:response regulator [Candidatus Kaiserbacteria bacterium]|nr:response regulator [Candidatus Kaiserbacteria bacterium]